MRHSGTIMMNGRLPKDDKLYELCVNIVEGMQVSAGSIQLTYRGEYNLCICVFQVCIAADNDQHVADKTLNINVCVFFLISH